VCPAAVDNIQRTPCSGRASSTPAAAAGPAPPRPRPAQSRRRPAAGRTPPPRPPGAGALQDSHVAASISASRSVKRVPADAAAVHCDNGAERGAANQPEATLASVTRRRVASAVSPGQQDWLVEKSIGAPGGAPMPARLQSLLPHARHAKPWVRAGWGMTWGAPVTRATSACTPSLAQVAALSASPTAGAVVSSIVALTASLAQNIHHA